MSNAIVLEKLNHKQLILLLIANFILLSLYFLAGGTGPKPTNVTSRQAKACEDKIQKFQRKNQPIDDNSCSNIINLVDDNPAIIENNIVFYFVFPSDKMPSLTMSRWFQWMIGVMDMKPLNDKRIKYKDTVITVTFKGAIYGRQNDKDDWKLVHDLEPTDTHNREISCQSSEYGTYECHDMPLFELGNVFYNHYLINIQLPHRLGVNNKVPRLESLYVFEIHQNGGFSKIYIGQKTVICPIVLLATILYIRQVKKHDRSPLLITKVISGFGIATVIYNLPLDYISLSYDVSFLRLWNDIVTGGFYASMAILWLLFIGEHRMDLDQRNKLSNYWKEISAISLTCITMFLLDIIDRGIQMGDPFHTLWATEGGQVTGRMMLIFSGCCAGIYTLGIIYLMIRASLSMSRKRSSLVNFVKVRRMYYEGLIYRFKIMIGSTVTCGVITVVMFIIVNLNEMYYKWGKGSQAIDIYSGFLIGVAGLWNLYVLNILLLYCPISNGVMLDAYETVEMVEMSDTVKMGGGQDALSTLTKHSID